MTNPTTLRLSNPTTGELGRIARAAEIETFRKVGAIDADGQTWYALAEVSREVEILVGIYGAEKPRTAALALAGDQNAIRSLEISAFRDETRESCGLALGAMSDKGWAIGAMHNRCHALAKVAKSWRARVILSTMARIALNALPVADRT